MSFLVILTICILIAISILHIYWANGGKFALDNAIPTTIKGIKVFNPGKLLTFLVSVLLLVFAYVAYILQFDNLNLLFTNYYMIAGKIVSTIFIIRVIGDFKYIGIFKKIQNTPFAIYDSKYYIPLCFIISVIFFNLVNNF